MDRIVFMDFDEFISFNTLLLKATGLHLYCSESHQHSYQRIDHPNEKIWRAFDLLIGRLEDEEKILHRPAIEINRSDQIGFVRIRYGGDDEHAIGSTWYGADGSDTMKLVNQELNKLLKKFAHKGIVDSDGMANKISNNYYWTDGALSSGKNWRFIFGSGVNKEKNKKPGFRPKF